MDRQEQLLNRALARVIAERRSDLGMTQADVWTAAGFSKTPYRDREQGKTAWQPDDLLGVARVLGTHAWKLMKVAEERVARDPSFGQDRAAAELDGALGLTE
ncbi:helix-turn-helix domain-containing protein [Nocardia sp. NPDC057455]|uniref:helix-turn-helix domain-containing protein n=1 Tax=Nocardia sp. NPDC057455 TaxID=3346138 RepID=UPI0036702F72